MSEGDGERTALRRWAATLALSGSGSRAGGEATRNAGWASAEGGGELGHARGGPAPGRGRTERTGLGSWAAGKGRWAARFGMWRREMGHGEERGRGLGWILFPFLFLKQTKFKPFEFKFELEFKPHSINKKIMRQHDCTTS